MANVLNREKRIAIVRCLVEGNSIRSTSRITGVCKEAILRLLCLLGPACEEYQAKTLRELKCKRVQCDEIFAFIQCKEAHLKPEERMQGRGTCYTHTAICADTKLLICWRVGYRETADTILFMEDLASRLSERIQLSTDGLSNYRMAVEQAFGSDVDFGTEIKNYGDPKEGFKTEARYSPSRCTSTTRNVLIGSPDTAHISTAFNERHNLTMRMQMRRFTRLTNGFSKKMENHAHAVSLHAMHYNFARVHQTLRMPPALAANVTDHVWSIEEIVGLLDA